jgi:hypothetical protein
MAAYVHGVQAARERLAKAQQALREAQASEAQASRLNKIAEELEAQVAEIRHRNRRPAYIPRAADNIHGGREGLLAAVAEIEEHNARKKAQKAIA